MNNSIPLFSIFPTNNTNSELSTYDYKLTHFFEFSSSTKIECKKFSESFIKQISFMTLPNQTYLENVSLNTLMLKEKDTFRKIIDNIDKDLFTSFPLVEYNSATKTTYLTLSKRINSLINRDTRDKDEKDNNLSKGNKLFSPYEYQSKQSFNLSEIALIFIEQVVMTRYLLYLEAPQTYMINSFKISTKEYNGIFNNLDELYKFFLENINKKGEKLFDSIDFKVLLDSVLKNNGIVELIKLKTKRDFGHYQTS
jgi:hypothetical protein